MRSLIAVGFTALASLFLLSVPRRGEAAHEAHSQPTVQVGIVLFDGVEIIDFTGPYEVFGQAGFGVVTVSSDGKPVTTAMGLRVTPDHSFADAPAFDVLLVPGGDVSAAKRDQAVLEFVRQRSAGAKHVLSVCTGAFILGASGLLDGRKATTFKPRFDQLAEEFPKITVVRDQRWVDSGKLITSAGLSSGIDAALHVVELLRGEEKARSIALTLEYDWHADRGFVRGRMADRYLPQLKNLELPQDIQTHDISAVGDERQWRRRTHVMTEMPVKELMQRVARATESEGWRRSGEADEQRWQRDVDGRHVTLTMATTAAEANAFELVIEVAVKDAGIR